MWHRRSAVWHTTLLYLHTLVLRHILRCILTEEAEIIVELHGEVATHNAIPSVLCITTTYGAYKGIILVEHIVHTHKYLTEFILEYLLTKIEIADEEVLVILISKADILVKVSCGS